MIRLIICTVTWMTCDVTLLLSFDVAALVFLDRFLGDDCLS